MKWVKRNDLDRYYSKLQNIKGDVLQQNALELLVDKGMSEAQTEYGGTHFEVASEVDDKNARIIASGSGIAYDEYGTGLVGEGTYEGELPTQTLTFISPKRKAGDTRPPRVNTTQGWEYYYDNPETKFMGGWFMGKGGFTRGQVASMRMYRTAKSLKEYVHNGLAKDIRSKQ